MGIESVTVIQRATRNHLSYLTTTSHFLKSLLRRRCVGAGAHCRSLGYARDDKGYGGALMDSGC
jgi:hypothetical protein